MKVETKTCKKCNGTGNWGGDRCFQCCGAGLITKTRLWSRIHYWVGRIKETDVLFLHQEDIKWLIDTAKTWGGKRDEKDELALQELCDVIFDQPITGQSALQKIIDLCDAILNRNKAPNKITQDDILDIKYTSISLMKGL